MEKPTKIIGILAFGIMAYFLYRANKEGDSEKAPIEGLSMNINPNAIVDSVIPLINANPMVKNTVSTGIKNMINTYMMNEQNKRVKRRG